MIVSSRSNIFPVLPALAVLLATFGVSNTGAHAAVIAAWDVNGVDLDGSTSGIDTSPAEAPYTFTAGNQDPDLDNAVLTLGGGVEAKGTNDTYGFSINNDNAETSLGGAIGANHYIQFTLKADAGFSLNLSSLEFNGEATSTGADDIAILSSVDGFSESNAIASVTDVATTTNSESEEERVPGGFDTDDSGFGAPIDLTAAKFQQLAEIDFRIYGWNSSSSAGRTSLRDLSGDDLVVNGTVALVPEPTSALVGLLLAAGLGYRRR